MKESEQIVAALIDNNKISGVQAVVLLRAIYGKETKETKDSNLLSGKITTITGDYWPKHTDVLCAATTNNNLISDNDILSSAVSITCDS